jgi:hypothetical protein
VVRSVPSSGRTPGAVATQESKRLLWKSMTRLYVRIEQMFDTSFGMARTCP